MKKLSKLKLALIISSVLIFVLLLLPRFYDEKTAFSADKETYKNLRLFNEILDLVEKNYVEEVDIQTLFTGAINGMIKTLDPHSTYMTAEMYQDLQADTRGSFGGLGIVITMKDDILTVVSPIEDTPAFLSGIKAGDQILKIDGKAIKGFTIQDAMHKLRGEKGTSVIITIMREEFPEPKDFIITRDIIKIKSVKHKLYDDRIAYIRISSFQETTEDELSDALKNINTSEPDINGLILDLRNNPGGLLVQAIKVSDMFLKSGTIVSTKGRKQSSDTIYTANDDNNEPVCPMIILINSGTASASEIVSGALQDNKRALLLGTQTFGKASMQVIIPLNDGSALKLTTAKYYTPNGTLIQAKGINPDIIIDFEKPQNSEKNNAVREKDLQGHIEGETENTDRYEEPAELKSDNQLKRAVDILKSWNIFHNMSIEQKGNIGIRG